MGPMISFAQNHEDVLLARAFCDQRTGFYVDVGAGHPIELSVTKHFYEAGWRGINVEPGRGFLDLLESDRPRDVNLGIALSDREGTTTLHEVLEMPELSCVSAAQAEALRARGLTLRSREVPLRTLARVCAEHAPDTIDFLKVDVEGHEREVILGADWRRWTPRVVVVETRLEGVDGPMHPRWEPLLRDAGYDFASEDGVNRFYVVRGERELKERLRQGVDAYLPFEAVDRYERAKEELRQLKRGVPRGAETEPRD